MSFRWASVPNVQGERKAPKWARSAAIDDNGDIFVPAAIAGSETAVFFCLGWDGGEPAVWDSKHLFVRASWLAKEFPLTREVCEKITKKMLTLAATETCE